MSDQCGALHLQRASFVRWLRRNQSEKYDVPDWPTIRNDYDLRNLRLELPSDAPPRPTWGEWRCVFHVIDMRAATRNQVLQWIRVVDHYGLVWWEFVPPPGMVPQVLRRGRVPSQPVGSAGVRQPRSWCHCLGCWGGCVRASGCWTASTDDGWGLRHGHVAADSCRWSTQPCTLSRHTRGQRSRSLCSSWSLSHGQYSVTVNIRQGLHSSLLGLGLRGSSLVFFCCCSSHCRICAAYPASDTASKSTSAILGLLSTLSLRLN